MWICPKCETFNRDGDARCYICSCEYKVYLYQKSLRIEEPPPPPEKAPEAYKYKSKEVKPESKAEGKPAARTSAVMKELRDISRSDYEPTYSKTPGSSKDKTGPGRIIAILLLVLLIAGVIYKVIEVTTSNSADAVAEPEYTPTACVSDDENETISDQVIECQNEEMNLFFL